MNSMNRDDESTYYDLAEYAKLLFNIHLFYYEH